MLFLFTAFTTSQGYAAPSPAEPKDLAKFPAFGVAFSPPKGWTEAARDKQNLIGFWVKIASPGASPDAMVIVEGAYPTENTVEKAAEGLAKTFGGQVLPKETQLDGVRALHVRSQKTGTQIHPVEALVAMRDGILYLVMGGVKDGHDCAGEIEHVRSTWKWIDFESPLKSVTLAPKLTQVFGGKFMFRIPLHAYSHPTENPAIMSEWAICYIKEKSTPFIVRATVAPKNPDITLGDLAKMFVEKMKNSMTIKDEPKWRAVGDPATRIISSPVEVVIPDGTKVEVQWGWIALGPKEVILLIFTETPTSKEEHAVCDKLAEDIVRSVILSKAPEDAAK